MSITRQRLLVYLVMLVSLVMAINLVKDISRLNRADERLLEADLELRSAREEQQELKRQLEVVGSSFWLEGQIRNILKMARPEEKVVVVPEMITQTAPVRQDFAGQAEEKSNLSLWLEVFGF